MSSNLAKRGENPYTWEIDGCTVRASRPKPGGGYDTLEMTFPEERLAKAYYKERLNPGKRAEDYADSVEDMTGDLGGVIPEDED